MIAKYTYLLLLACALIISAFSILNSNVIGGDVGNFDLELTAFEFILIVLVNIFLIPLFYGFYKVLSGIRLKTPANIVVQKKSFNYFIFFLLLSHLTFLHITGVGRILSDASSPYSPIFAALSPDFLILLYYLICRKNSGLIFFVNIFLFSILSLSKGYTGFLLLFFIFELYFYFLNKNISFNHKVFMPFFFVFFIFFFGSLVYKILDPIKNEVRGLGSSELSYAEALSKLSDRFTFLPASTAGLQRLSDVKVVYNDSNVELKEMFDFLRPITPSFFFDKNSFNSLGNDVQRVYKPDITPATSSDLGIFSYTVMLLVAEPKQAVIYIIFS